MSGKNIISIMKKSRVIFKKNIKIFSPKKEPYGKKSSLKYFIGYNNDGVIRPLCIKLPQMIRYVECFYSNKTMSFKASDNKLLKKYAEIWERVSSLMKIKFGSEPVYGDNDKYIKTKIKLYGDKANTNFQDKKVQQQQQQQKMHHIKLILTLTMRLINNEPDNGSNE